MFESLDFSQFGVAN